MIAFATLGQKSKKGPLQTFWKSLCNKKFSYFKYLCLRLLFRLYWFSFKIFLKSILLVRTLFSVSLPHQIYGYLKSILLVITLFSVSLPHQILWVLSKYPIFGTPRSPLRRLRVCQLPRPSGTGKVPKRLIFFEVLLL